MGILEQIYLGIIFCIIGFYLFRFGEAVATKDYTKLNKALDRVWQVFWTMVIILFIILVATGKIFQELGPINPF